ncbi:hypothetical protein ACI2OX_04275 [Bacillus sp. N9]
MESALKQIGLLDSLITNEPIKPTHDQVIHTNPLVLASTLADYLRPDLEEGSLISEQIVDEVLRSIPIEQEGSGLHIDVDGSYSIGCLVGHAPNLGPSKYIGRSSRKRFQQEKIKECELKLEQLQIERAEMHEQRLECEEKIRRTAIWKETIPEDKDLFDINHEMKMNEMKVEQEQEALNLLDQEWKDMLSQMRKIKVKIHEKGSMLNLKLTREAVDEALTAASSYIQYLHSLQITFQQCAFLSSKLQIFVSGSKKRSRDE